MLFFFLSTDTCLALKSRKDHLQLVTTTNNENCVVRGVEKKPEKMFRGSARRHAHVTSFKGVAEHENFHQYPGGDNVILSKVSV